MVRLAIPVIAALVVFVVYAVVDCAFFDRLRIRGLSRGWWIVVILLVPVIGAILWFVIGRGSAHRKPGRGPMAPDDDIAFLQGLKEEAAQAERIHRMEQELADLDSPPTEAAEDTHPAAGAPAENSGADCGADSDADTGTDTDDHPGSRTSDDPEFPDESSGRSNA